MPKLCKRWHLRLQPTHTLLPSIPCHPPVRQLMVVVLPAPLGPSRQNTRSRSMAYLRTKGVKGAQL